MPQQAQVKNYWTFVKGLVTEASPLAFPENAALDLDNVVLDIDGSITPREGFSVMSTLLTDSSTLTEYQRGFTTFQWESAGGSEGTDFFVVRSGNSVRFYTNGVGTPTNTGFAIDLADYFPNTSTYAASVLQTSTCSFAAGDGRLYIATPYTEIVIVEYINSNFQASTLTVQERNLEILEDGTPPEYHPTVLEGAHRYNLRNAGWNDDKIVDYFSQLGEFPSRSEDPWTGIIEVVDPNTGAISIKFQADAYRALGDVGFGTSEAAKGSLLLDTFDTRLTLGQAGDMNIQSVSGIMNGTDSFVPINTTTYTITVEDTSGLTVGLDVNISGSQFWYRVDGSPTALSGSLDGAWEVLSIPNGTTFVIQLNTSEMQSTGMQYAHYFNGNLFRKNWTSHPGDLNGVIPGDPLDVISEGYLESKRFEVVACHAGRLFMAGCQADTRKELVGRIYYSQVIRNTNNIGRAYTVNDPAAKVVNDVLATDGGYINIEEIGVVHAMMPFESSLIVITTKGVWEIGAGESVFTPTGYTVRKLSSRGSRFKNAVLEVDGRPCYWSNQGIELVTTSEITGMPEVSSLTDNTIKTYVQQPIVANSVSATYDNIDNKIYWSFELTSDAGAVSRILSLDMRLGAFAPWSMAFSDSTLIRGIEHFDNGTEERLRVISQVQSGANWTLYLNEQDLSNNTDQIAPASTATQFSAYIESGYDNQGDGMRTKQAVKLHTFCERNMDSSLITQGRYDWSLTGTSGKWTVKQQAYRDLGEGYGVCVSRLRMRGSGTTFRVRYSSEGTAPFKLYGWSILYVGGSTV